MKYEKSCGAVIVNDGKVLLVKQKSGSYGFPKGHMEKGETEIETTIREVKEETNIDIEVVEKRRYQITYSPKRSVTKDVVYFLAHPKSFDIKKQEEEISDIAWVEFKKVNDVLSFENLKGICYRVLKDEKLIK